MSEDLSWISGGVVGIGDTLAHGGVTLAVEFAGLALGGMSEASGASAVVALATTLVAIPSLPPPFPFFEAEGKWKELATSIREAKTELGDLVSKNGVDAQWEGPAADAFCHYVNATLLPAMEKVAMCADEEAGCSSTVAWGLIQGLIIHFAQCAVGIALCIASNYLNAMPIVGAFLCAMAKWIIVDQWIFGLLYNVYDMYNSLQSLEGEQSQLKAAQQQLATAFGTDSDKFDAAALERLRKEVEPVMKNTGGWNKP
jgi:hypothetical protein